MAESYDGSASGPSNAQLWRWSFVAAMAGFIDAGSIVATGVGALVWASEFGFGDTYVGVLGAIGPNAMAAGVGALVGGWICDKFGRKKIYAYDLLLYMLGALVIAFSVDQVSLTVGFVLIGLAVGADIPASWSLVTELAPARKRGRLGSLSQVLWYAGPVTVLLLGLWLTQYGLLGVRLMFGFLFLVALATYIMRQGIAESARWKHMHRDEQSRSVARRTIGDDYRELLSRRGMRPLLMLLGVYGFWNLFAGTNGFYLPLFLQEYGSLSEAASIGMQCLYFGLTIVATAFVFIPLVDRVDRRVLFAVGSLSTLAGALLLAMFSVSPVLVTAYIVITGLAQGLGAQHFFQLWSGEEFPTRLRATAQGVVMGVVRLTLGVWSFFVPVIAAATGSFQAVAVILSAFLLVSSVIGIVWSRNQRGKTLEEIEVEQGWASEGARFDEEEALHEAAANR
ncbi:MAG: MFS transporter [Actinophytocola sp.]|nr:MFS transporter [Actinophytocola sp.]